MDEELTSRGPEAVMERLAVRLTRRSLAGMSAGGLVVLGLAAETEAAK